MRIIWEHEDFRIVELPDDHWSLEDLKGDTYSPEHNPDIPLERLRSEEREFEALVNNEGVFGYVLEVWNPKIGHGWEHVDGCFGFVGQYEDSKTSRFNHYIVEELKGQAK